MVSRHATPERLASARRHCSQQVSAATIAGAMGAARRWRITLSRRSCAPISALSGRRQWTSVERRSGSSRSVPMARAHARRSGSPLQWAGIIAGGLEVAHLYRKGLSRRMHARISARSATSQQPRQPPAGRRPSSQEQMSSCSAGRWCSRATRSKSC